MHHGRKRNCPSTCVDRNENVKPMGVDIGSQTSESASAFLSSLNDALKSREAFRPGDSSKQCDVQAGRQEIIKPQARRGRPRKDWGWHESSVKEKNLRDDYNHNLWLAQQEFLKEMSAKQSVVNRVALSERVGYDHVTLEKLHGIDQVPIGGIHRADHVTFDERSLADNVALGKRNGLIFNGLRNGFAPYCGLQLENNLDQILPGSAKVTGHHVTEPRPAQANSDHVTCSGYLEHAGKRFDAERWQREQIYRDHAPPLNKWPYYEEFPRDLRFNLLRTSFEIPRMPSSFCPCHSCYEMRERVRVQWMLSPDSFLLETQIKLTNERQEIECEHRGPMIMRTPWREESDEGFRRAENGGSPRSAEDGGSLRPAENCGSPRLAENGGSPQRAENGGSPCYKQKCLSARDEENNGIFQRAESITSPRLEVIDGNYKKGPVLTACFSLAPRDEHVDDSHVGIYTESRVAHKDMKLPSHVTQEVNQQILHCYKSPKRLIDEIKGPSIVTKHSLENKTSEITQKRKAPTSEYMGDFETDRSEAQIDERIKINVEKQTLSVKTRNGLCSTWNGRREGNDYQRSKSFEDFQMEKQCKIRKLKRHSLDMGVLIGPHNEKKFDQFDGDLSRKVPNNAYFGEIKEKTTHRERILTSASPPIRLTDSREGSPPIRITDTNKVSPPIRLTDKCKASPPIMISNDVTCLKIKKENIESYCMTEDSADVDHDKPGFKQDASVYALGPQDVHHGQSASANYKQAQNCQLHQTIPNHKQARVINSSQELTTTESCHSSVIVANQKISKFDSLETLTKEGPTEKAESCQSPNMLTNHKIGNDATKSTKAYGEEMSKHWRRMCAILHSTSQPEDKPKEYTCEFCGRAFTHLSSLNNHTRTHTGHKPFKCDYCGKRFAQSGVLTAHLRTHTGDRPFKCPICGREFAQTTTLSNHIRTHTGQKPFRCRTCFRAFAQSSTRNKHELSHSREKPFNCKYCDRSFSQSSTVLRHMRTHDKDKSYRCVHCGQVFAYLYALDKHLDTHGR
ncbi:uncharacterized protein LOC5513869 [Nematostella vectensis]|nr:uncharacterized protein LOC5513869 [Nematostella vectensis]XP_048577539.1 uncharacterized protein LOC5513869 [Nematostella vectensis]XP_048577540.1 uncharacterized protein LOC5513869 [Nematostella vectensis]XP_048577541.1 uncharacterized protein LOC5513869 [Nematostella vectensis]XP_048577542.1 uncharacterized protein LOC5513869 [Nematostella vectensis]XP_048577543.1 uncharacterized protein LOC5513869 [Nematostella vectensis]